MVFDINKNRDVYVLDSYVSDEGTWLLVYDKDEDHVYSLCPTDWR